MRSYLSWVFGLGVLLLIAGVILQPIYAQTDCAALVQAALSNLEANCASPDGSSACFGSAASATFVAGASAPFEKAGDQVALSQLQTISTSPLSSEANQWGLAVVHVPANVPRALSEQGLNYILMGDVTVENAVPLDEAYTPAEPITVTALVGSNLRSSPTTDARVVASASVGTELPADGLSADKGWLRVLYENQTVWVSRQIVAAKSGNIDDLPVVDSNARTLMQSFYLSTGTDDPACSGAPPSMLVIQGPDGVTANIVVNGIDIRIGSTVALRLLPGNLLQLFVISGNAYSGNVSVPAGFTITIQLSADGKSADGLWTGQRPITSDERTFLTSLEDVPSSLLYYALKIPTQAEVSALLAELNKASTGKTVSGPASSQADCSHFRPTSPLDQLAFGQTSFYWDGAPGATSYQLNIYDANGNIIRSYSVGALSTTFTTDTSDASIGGGGAFLWDIVALVGDQVACAAGPVSVAREQPAPQPVSGNGGGAPRPQPTPTACPWSSC